MTASVARAEPSAEGSDVVIRAAFDDLTKYVGHELGSYTNEMQNFLYELMRSSIPDSIKQLVMIGRDPAPLFMPFKRLLDTYSMEGVDADKLFKLLTAAIKARFSTSLGPQSIIDVVNKRGDEVLSRLEAIINSANNLDKSEIFTAQEVFETRLKVARHIEVQNKTLTVETTQGARKVPIKKLVVPARMEEVHSKSDAVMPHRDAHRDSGQPVPFLSFRRTFFNAVILGDPGGGKTTLTQLLCYDLANQIILEAAAPKAKHFDVSDLKIPLRIVLRAFEKRVRSNPSYNFLDYIVDELRIIFANDDRKCAAFVGFLLNVGQAVIIFDGLDEILNVGMRREIAAKIEEFSLVHPNCPALATSRIVGYNDAPLPYEFRVFTLSRFNDTEIEKFSVNLLSAVSQHKSTTAKEQASKFLVQSEANAPDLRTNPLMLGLMLYIFIFKGDVPSNRPEIYKECSMLMFEKWDQRRGIVFDFPQDFDLLDLFGFLASRIFGDAEAEEGVSAEWLTREVRKFFSEWYSDRTRSVEAARTLVDFITGRAWVMCEVGPNTFKFTHRTFLEYFFARRIEEEAGSVRDLIQRSLYQKIVSAEWDVVNHLALQTSTFRSSPKSLQAIQALINPGKEEHSVLSDDQRFNYIYFVVRTLDYLVLPEAKVLEVCNFVLDELFSLREFNYQNACEVMHGLLKFSRSKSQIVADHLSSELGKIVSNAGDVNRIKAIYILGNFYAGFRARRLSPVNGEDFELVWRSLAPARTSVRSNMLDRARLDISEARCFIYMFKSNVVELMAIHGLGLAMFNGEDAAPYEINSLACVLATQYLLFVTTSRRSLLDEERFDESDIAGGMEFIVAAMESLSISGELEDFLRKNWNPISEESLLGLWDVFLYAASKPRGIVRRLPAVADAFFVLLILQMNAHKRGGHLEGRVARHHSLRSEELGKHDIYEVVRMIGQYASSDEKRRRIEALGNEFASLMATGPQVER
ncbi:NACHT domain-containing protein [Gemmobacter nanjingensis]|nr:hypothetical protein [Gemmobacter nanjingensis]